MIRSDLYTKIVLTIIAVCLVVLCLQSFRAPVPVYAQSAGQRVVIAGFDAGAMKNGMPVWLAGGNGSIPVVITGGNTPVPVTTSGQAPLSVAISK